MVTNKYKILKEYENNLMILNDLLGVKSTNSDEINNICKYLFDNFKGVFASDQIPRLYNNECCIVNVDDSTKRGSHWCSIYVYKNKHYIYDSYNRNIKLLFPKLKNYVNANTDRDQSFKEEDCGPRSICWLISFSKYKDKIINVI